MSVHLGFWNKQYMLYGKHVWPQRGVMILRNLDVLLSYRYLYYLVWMRSMME